MQGLPSARQLTARQEALTMQTEERNVLDQLMDWVKIIQSLSKVYTSVFI